MNVWQAVVWSLVAVAAAVGLVWAFAGWVRWREHRRVQAAAAVEQFRREFSSALAHIGPMTAAAIGASAAATRRPMPRQKSDKSFFSGRGETHGVVYGMRNWKIDALGRLTGKVFPQAVWIPGPNDARCYKSLPYGSVPYGGTPSSVPTGGYPADHSMDSCEHGFYAYYDGSRDYHERGDVTGIIRGWGEAVVGEKGFRVMKAEIVALKFSGGISPQIQARVEALYPDAAVFKSLEAMLREFPTTAGGLEYLPEADDDFWTRGA